MTPQKVTHFHANLAIDIASLGLDYTAINRRYYFAVDFLKFWLL